MRSAGTAAAAGRHARRGAGGGVYPRQAVRARPPPRGLAHGPSHAPASRGEGEGGRRQAAGAGQASVRAMREDVQPHADMQTPLASRGGSSCVGLKRAGSCSCYDAQQEAACAALIRPALHCREPLRLQGRLQPAACTLCSIPASPGAAPRSGLQAGSRLAAAHAPPPAPAAAAAAAAAHPPHQAHLVQQDVARKLADGHRLAPLHARGAGVELLCARQQARQGGRRDQAVLGGVADACAGSAWVLGWVPGPPTLPAPRCPAGSAQTSPRACAGRRCSAGKGSRPGGCGRVRGCGRVVGRRRARPE